MTVDETTHLEEPGVPAPERTHVEPPAQPGPYQRVNLPGPLVERFEVVGAIPGGAEADLLVVRPRGGGDLQVVKLYRLALQPPPEDVRARIAAVDRAHVVQVSPPETWQGVTYEVMEHCGGSLRSLIEREGPRLGEGLVRQVLVQLYEALRHIHAPEIGLVHRDLKPANVLVRTREPLDLVLADFGLSEIIGDHSKLFLSAQRTIAYAAPEATHGTINRKSDWWSVGMCVAEMLLGAHPILRELGPAATEQVVSQWISDRPVPLEGLGGRWHALCEGLLTKDAEARWGEAEVGRWLAGEDPRVRGRVVCAALPEASVAPFAFGALEGEGFDAYDDPRLLAAAFGRHWDEALAIVSGQRAKRGESRRLAVFLRELGLRRAEAILLEGGDDEARLVRLRLTLDPECEPVFRSVDLAGDGLRRFAAAAAVVGADASAADCAAMLDARVLASHAAQAGRRGWAAFDAEWLAADEYAVEQLTRIRARAYLPALDAAAGAAIRVQLLHAIVDPDAAARLYAAADVAGGDEHARSQAWFRELADRHVTGRESLGVAAVLVAAHGTAAEQADQDARRRRSRERHKRVQEEYEALGREMVDTLTKLPPIEPPRLARREPETFQALGVLIWLGMTGIAAGLAAAGLIPEHFMRGGPILLGPLAFLAAWLLYGSHRDKAESEFAAARRAVQDRAVQRATVEASYTTRMEELLSREQ
jgi:hypothetical protein